MSATRIIKNTHTPAQCNWPADMTVQGGDRGAVFVRGGQTYFTAFVEAFPPNSFLRGEGATIEQAEQDCFAQWLTMQACGEHGPFERRDYVNGAGFCTRCGCWFSGVFDPLPQPERELADWEKEIYARLDALKEVDINSEAFKQTVADQLDRLARQADEIEQEFSDKLEKLQQQNEALKKTSRQRRPDKNQDGK